MIIRIVNKRNIDILYALSFSVLDLDFGKNWNLRRIGAILGAKWGGSSVFFIVYMYTNEVR